MSYPAVIPDEPYGDMKLLTFLVCGVVAIAARAEDQGVEFYGSQMRWSSNPDPLDAGAIDGAYYADLLATHGVRKVEFDVVSAKEMLNPRWNSDAHEADEYALSFTFGFNQEAAIRGMIGPDGKPYTSEDKTPQELTLEMEHFAERVARGQFNQATPATSTPTPGPVNSSTAPMPKEMEEKIKAERLAKEEEKRKLFEKQEAEREAQGDFSQAPGLTPEQREAAEMRWWKKNAAESIKGATPAPQ